MLLTPAFVTADWLFANRASSNLCIVDGSFKMPGVAPDAAADYAATHIPDAVFFDVNEIADKTSPLPHMLPDAASFAAHMQALGIGSTDHVVVYDNGGVLGAARVWWSLRVFGHERISVLEGGLRRWIAAGYPVDDHAPMIRPAEFQATLNPALIRDWRKVFGDQASGQEQIVDARAEARFKGEVEEPRAGLRRGHIPGSLNVDYTRLIDPDTNALRAPEAIQGVFKQAGVNLDRPIVASCGSGVSAAVLALGLFTAGLPDIAVYDGSWAEWGLPLIPEGWTNPLPIETGAARRTET